MKSKNKKFFAKLNNKIHDILCDMHKIFMYEVFQKNLENDSFGKVSQNIQNICYRSNSSGNWQLTTVQVY